MLIIYCDGQAMLKCASIEEVGTWLPKLNKLGAHVTIKKENA